MFSFPLFTSFLKKQTEIFLAPSPLLRTLLSFKVKGSIFFKKKSIENVSFLKIRLIHRNLGIKLQNLASWVLT